MKPKLLSAMLVMALLAVMIVPSASAALPSGVWVKYSGNPVVPNGLCGVGNPMRPAVIVESPNHYTMYFSNIPGTGTALYMATSADGGQTWACGNSNNPVLLPGASGAWDDTRAMAASVIRESSTSYKMWYTGRNSAGAYAIGYATSSDGISWTKYGSNQWYDRK